MITNTLAIIFLLKLIKDIQHQNAYKMSCLRGFVALRLTEVNEFSY